MNASISHDFGPIDRSEFIILETLAGVVRPNELGGLGFTLGLVDGVRTWQHAEDGLVVTFRGGVVGGTTDTTYIVPPRILEHAFQIANVNPEAHLVVEDGWLTIGSSDDLVSTNLATGQPMTPSPSSSVARTTVATSSLKVMLATLTASPNYDGGADVNWPTGTLVNRAQHLEGKVDWSIAGGRDVVTRVPATSTGDETTFVVSLWCLHRITRLVQALCELPKSDYRGDWTIEIDDAENGTVKLGNHDVEIVAPRCPSAGEQLMLAVAQSIESTLDIDVAIDDRTTIETTVEGETIVGQVFAMPELHVRLSVPVCDVESAAIRHVLAELNGHNESRLTSTAFLDHTTVHVRHSLPTCDGMVDAIPAVVRRLVADAKALRANVTLASTIGDGRA